MAARSLKDPLKYDKIHLTFVFQTGWVMINDPRSSGYNRKKNPMAISLAWNNNIYRKQQQQQRTSIKIHFTCIFIHVANVYITRGCIGDGQKIRISIDANARSRK